ncbi:MAG TPA: DnaJ domain-containing protein, partial [Candidatus Limnocylindrales bacterium]|nr:DnaJ domain-containing protein [Candidatus Limnocylindrales bacterium]
MTGSLDPWRTLGLVPGSSLDEIRRAYRRLAKANHPDAAGEGALPRFLAIQSAYEALAGPQRGRRPGARPAPAARDDAWRSTRAGGRPSGASSGATSGPRRPAAGARPSGARPSGSSGAGAGSADETGAGRGATDGPAGRRPSGRPTEAGTPRRPGSRRRAPNRATPGSTSYDAADEEPFEPGWTGATWYGASSGTYWTINPKEYADPRKHGPEYQRRARRSASGAWIVEDADGDERA